MANFLTTGRKALVAALKADPTLDAAVRYWFDWAGGLRKRKALEPNLCPLVSIAPAEGGVERNANVIRDIPQVLQVDVADEGDDVSQVEELVVAVIEVINVASETRLGLVAEGLANVTITGINWSAVPAEEGARIIWVCSVMVRLLYKRP